MQVIRYPQYSYCKLAPFLHKPESTPCGSCIKMGIQWNFYMQIVILYFELFIWMIDVIKLYFWGYQSMFIHKSLEADHVLTH